MRGHIDKFFSTILRLLPFILSFTIPLFFLPFTNDFFTFNKFYLITFLASLALASWCIRSLVRGQLTITASPSLLPLTIFILGAVVSSLWISPVKHLSLFGGTTLFISLFIIFLTTTSSQKNTTLVDTTVIGLIISTAILNLFTILHRFNLLTGLSDSNLLKNPTFNLSGGILPAITYTIPILIATLFYLVTTKKLLHKSLLFTATILMIVGTIINLSILFPRSGQQLLTILPYRAGWSIAVDIFKTWPTALFGTGPDTYLSTFTRLRPSFLNQDNLIWNFRFSESSNFILTLLTTTGLITTFAFITAIISPILIYFSRVHTPKHPSLLFFTTILISSIIVALIVPTGLVSLVTIFISLIGITVEFKNQNTKNISDITLNFATKSERLDIYQDISNTNTTTPHNLVFPWILSICSTLLLIAYWVYAVPAYKASASAKQASEQFQTNPVGAYLKLLDAEKLDQYNPNYSLTLSQLFKNSTINLITKKDATESEKKSAAEQMQRSIDHAKIAAKRHPYHVLVWENLADIYQSFIGAADGAQSFAVSHLAQAITLDPTNPKLRLQLAILFFNLGDTDQATRLTNQAIELKPNWDIPYYNLSAIYKYKKDYPKALQYAQSGLRYTGETSSDYTRAKEEIRSLEKLQQSNATPSATVR